MAAQTTANQKESFATTSEQASVPSPHHQHDLWGIILTEGGRQDVRIKDDTGTQVNWIHPNLVKRFKLKIESCNRQTFEDFQGKSFKVEHVVWFTWMGRRQDKECTYYGEFYIAPERSSIEVVLGEQFVHENGLARDVCNLRRRTQPSRIFASDKKSKTEEEAIKENREKNDREAREAAEAREKKKRENKHKSQW
ncbi:hypothetical protein AB5N19_09640 [Seiridium cardinale]